MPLDRFVRFQEGEPSEEEAIKAVKEYGKYIFMMVELKENTIFLYIPGRVERYGEIRPRWVEVFLSRRSTIDVMTRDMDAITNDIADGLARYLARKFKGVLEE